MWEESRNQGGQIVLPWDRDCAAGSRLSWLSLIVYATLVVACVVWAMGWIPKFHVPSKKENQKAERLERQMWTFQTPIVERARKLIREGRYSPRRYEEDLIAIHRKDEKLGHPEPERMGAMKNQEVANYALDNLHLLVKNRFYYRDSFVWQKYNVAAYNAQEWARKHCQEPTGGRLVSEALKKAGWRAVGTWCGNFYWRTAILCLPLFVMRMRRRKGILATILADKRAFLLYWILWPVGIFRYPYNVVREIRVEAELRRMGDVFRRFSARERQYVREIANSDRYKPWLAGRQIGRVQRSLVVALMATIILWLVSPILVARVEAAPRGKPATTVTAVARAGPTLISMFCVDDGRGQNHQDVQGDSSVCIDLSPVTIVERPDQVDEMMKPVRYRIRRGEPGSLDHVPWTDCLGSSVSRN